MEGNSKSFLQKLMVWQGLTHSLHLALDHLCSNETLMPVRLLRPASSRQLEGLPKQAELLGGSDGVPITFEFHPEGGNTNHGSRSLGN